MDKGLVKVLLVEDDAVDSRLVKRVLAECPQPAELRLGWNWTDNPADTFFYYTLYMRVEFESEGPDSI